MNTSRFLQELKLYNMGCLTVKAFRISGVKANAERKFGMMAKSYRVGGIKANCYLFCEIATDTYLRVKPKVTQWIDIDISAQYHVVSNEAWIIQ